ncbi:hypothetical protein P8452_23788 [Trifolium repens]|nr:hypothetical protein P8452_23788 [Trifolium repens]
MLLDTSSETSFFTEVISLILVQSIRKSDVSDLESSIDTLIILLLDASSHRIDSLFLRLELDLNFISNAKRCFIANLRNVPSPPLPPLPTQQSPYSASMSCVATIKST